PAGERELAGVFDRELLRGELPNTLDERDHADLFVNGRVAVGAVAHVLPARVVLRATPQIGREMAAIKPIAEAVEPLGLIADPRVRPVPDQVEPLQLESIKRAFLPCERRNTSGPASRNADGPTGQRIAVV